MWHSTSFVVQPSIAARMFDLVRPSRIAALAIIVAVPMLISNCRQVVSSAMNVPAYIGTYDRHAGIAYGALPRQTLDVYVPRGAANRPVVVFWHGGSWQRGRKEEVRFVGAALAGAGYIAILPDYRLYPEARFPQFIDDGALAVKWAREHARVHGGDPDAIFVMGHSAGGHLAATLALDERYLRKAGGQGSWIRGWIGLSAPYELRWHLPRSLSILGAHAAAEWRPIALVPTALRRRCWCTASRTRWFIRKKRWISTIGCGISV
jgi:poly(3-hydroxybutyrate) depolymerase